MGATHPGQATAERCNRASRWSSGSAAGHRAAETAVFGSSSLADRSARATPALIGPVAPRPRRARRHRARRVPRGNAPSMAPYPSRISSSTGACSTGDPTRGQPRLTTRARRRPSPSRWCISASSSCPVPISSSSARAGPPLRSSSRRWVPSFRAGSGAGRPAPRPARRGSCRCGGSDHRGGHAPGRSGNEVLGQSLSTVHLALAPVAIPVAVRQSGASGDPGETALGWSDGSCNVGSYARRTTIWSSDRVLRPC